MRQNGAPVCPSFARRNAKHHKNMNEERKRQTIKHNGFAIESTVIILSTP